MPTEPNKEILDSIKAMYDAFYDVEKKTEAQFDAIDEACRLLDKYGLFGG